jgi:nicastrin
MGHSLVRPITVFRMGSVIISLLLFRIQQPTYAALDQPFTVSYSSLQHAPCVSLFHRNGRIGCGTEDHSVQVGRLMYYQGSIPDASDDGNYVAVVEDYDMVANTITTLIQDKGGRLQGILVLNSTSTSNSKNGYTIYSPESRTPQGYNTPSSQLNYGYIQYQWNSRGEDIISSDLFGVPIAYIKDGSVAQSLRIEGQSGSTKATNNAIVAEFDYYMGPEAMDSVTCLSWKDVSNDRWNPKCLPLGGTSVWASAGSPPPASSDATEQQQQKPIIVVGAGMDSTSLYHDLTPGANTAASNIITMLIAAKLIGSLTDTQLDELPNSIVFALFQGESYGFVGSRSFLRDLSFPGFACNSDLVRSKPKLGDKSEYGCLNPLRPNMRFADLGSINGMLSIDQVGHAVASGNLFVHADNDQYGTYLANILKYCGTNKFSVVASAAVDNGYGYPYPPSPLTSLLQLSGGAIGGAVLTGYDYDYPSKIPFHSHMDLPAFVELQTLAAAATIVARAALAAAYDDGTYSGQNDYQTPSTYATNLIPELSSSDATLVELSNCFLYDGNCDLIMKYSTMEASNEKIRSGTDIQVGESLGTPPNYYVGPYNYGQPYVQVGDSIYGAYNGSDFGKKNSDVITMRPRQLESTIFGLFNDYLGRGSSTSSDATPTSCKKLTDCAKVESICNTTSSDTVTCSGSGVCVCIRAQYHVALDQALLMAVNMSPGYFIVDDTNGGGIGPIYAEPFWSPSVYVRVYRDASALPGFFTLIAGLGIGAVSFFGAIVLKVGLKKEKLY